MPAEAAQPLPDAGEGAEAPAPQAPGGIPTEALLGIVIDAGSPSVPVTGVPPAVAGHGLEVIREEPLGITRPRIGRYGRVTHWVLRDGPSSSPAVAERQIMAVVDPSGRQ